LAGFQHGTKEASSFNKRNPFNRPYNKRYPVALASNTNNPPLKSPNLPPFQRPLQRDIDSMNESESSLNSLSINMQKSPE